MSANPSKLVAWKFRLFVACLGFSALIAHSVVHADAAETACFESSTDNLVLATEGYQCLPAEHSCEQDFSQREDGREKCERRDDCRYLPGVCYCPAGVVCVCAGGPPSVCLAQNDDREFVQRHRAILVESVSESLQPGNRDGELMEHTDRLLAWDSERNQWVSPEQFWLQYAQRRGGLSWPRSQQYPPYREVKEFDTFLVETAHGPCLMEFFHNRWRRANDVRRWDQRFNDYGGCPRVFD